MKKTAIALAVAASFTAAGNVSAASTEDRLMAMEKRLQYLEQRIASQDRVIAEKDRQLSELTGGEDTGGAWFSKVEVGGVVEIEASHTDEDGSDSSDVITPTVELGVSAQINDWVSGEIVLLYEEETDNDGDLNVDTAMMTIADPDASWFVNAGQYVVPFGTFNTNMVADPITLDFAETGDSAIELGINNGGMTASAYIFQGDREEETGTWGAALFYETESEDMTFAGHVGYISDLLESDGMFEASDAGDFSAAGDEAPAWTASAAISAGAFTVMGEYVAATDALVAGSSDEPSAYNLELAYGFELSGKPATIAIGYQGSDEAEDIGLPEEKILGAISVEIMDATTLALELSNEEGYDGSDADTVTGFMAFEF